MRLYALLLAALLTPPALAEVRPSEIARPARDGSLGLGYRERSYVFILETGLNFQEIGGESAFSISPLIGISAPVGFNEMELWWGFSGLSITDAPNALDPGTTEDQGTFKIGNPYLAYFFAWRKLERQMRAGIGLSAPAATLRTDNFNDTLLDVLAYGRAAGMRGMRDYWLWAPETLSAVGHFDFYYRWANGIILGGEVDVAAMLGVGDNDATNLLAQAIGEVAYDSRYVRGALSASYATMPLAEEVGTTEGPGGVDLPEFRYPFDDSDNDQIAVAPSARFRVIGAVDIVTTFMINIDEPFGLSFDDDRMWGVLIALENPTDLRLPKQ